MRVDFKCGLCEKVEEVNYALKDGPPKEVVCPQCGSTMNRVFGKTAVDIPEYFGDQDFNALTTHMRNAPLPSGRKHAVY